MAQPSPATSDDDAITMVMNDHREVERLYSEFGKAAPEDGARRQALAKDIIRELSVHAAAEEMYLYPLTAEAVSNGEHLADHSLEEHHDIKERLSDLDRMTAWDRDYGEKLTQVISTVSHHVEEEEGDLFPALRRSVSAERVAEAGKKMQRAKAVGPTRPHPAPPTHPRVTRSSDHLPLYSTDA